MQYKYKRYLFDFDIHYQTRNQLFVFDKVADEFIGSDGDYHLIINDRYQRYEKGVPDVNEFLYEYYWNIESNHKNVIYNQTTYALLTPVVFIQTKKKRVLIKKGISTFAAPSNIRGKYSIYDMTPL